jgi:hypothetical protein
VAPQVRVQCIAQPDGVFLEEPRELQKLGAAKLQGKGFLVLE